MSHLIEDLTAFLAASPTSWHAVQEMGNRLALRNFTPLETDQRWSLERGSRYFVAKDGTLAAFVLPKKPPKRLVLLGAHTDSPALKLKPQPLIRKANMLQLGVEVYGGPTLASWMNRDLCIAGRVMTLNKHQEIEQHLVYIDEAPLFIPLLAIHLDRSINDKGLELNKQDHLIPVAALADEERGEHYLEDLLHRSLAFEKLLAHDLFLVPMEAPRCVGAAGEMLAGYRLDNLSSCFAALVALGHLEEASDETLQLGVFWDHEEIGSETSVGADSPFFHDLLDRIYGFYGLGWEERILLKEHSLCLSLDVGHGLNPNYEKKYDPQHLPLLGKGVVIKSNANQRYSSTAPGIAKIAALADRLGLKMQQYVSRSDLSSGSTIGPVFAKRMGIETVDLGLAQLSMHATREVVACQDLLDLTQLLIHALQEPL